jgi:hypothetical protein
MHRCAGLLLTLGLLGACDDEVPAQLRVIGGEPARGQALLNQPMMLTAWLRDPPAIDPATAVPDLSLSEPEARHVAAYLYTLR